MLDEHSLKTSKDTVEKLQAIILQLISNHKDVDKLSHLFEK